MVKPVVPDARIIFICYRREDSGDRAHHLHESLRTHFGDDQVFIDLDVPPGADVRRYITDKISSCVVLLAVIGPDWLTSSDEHGTRRLDSELDYVRLEIATALNTNSTVVPVLVKTAGMPVRSKLPPEISRLADLNALQLSDGVHWRSDVALLIAAIERILATPEPVDLTRERPTSRVWPRPRGLPVWLGATARRRSALALAVIALAAVVVAILVVGSGDHSLRIYSSLPEREQQQPLGTVGSGLGGDLGVVRNERTRDLEDAMRLALNQAGRKAGDFDVTYQALDDSDVIGESPAALVQANAREAADDDDTAVYIGDLTSGATQESIPILSRAKIPQISMSSTRIGLTKKDPRGDVNEPDRYYPPQPGYSRGYRNFVRIIPRDLVQAKALLARMTQSDGCHTVAMINDNSSYGEALANNILEQNRRRVRFVFSQPVGPYGGYEHLVERARREKPDCFVYGGIRNPNTVEIFEAFARALPTTAKLYGTDGVVAASFYDSKAGGLPQNVGRRVTVMVPPYADNAPYQRFVATFTDTYDRTPDPYAVYAYEAMQLALEAIADSTTGERKDILNELFHAQRDAQDSALGTYSITDSGDTDVATYGVSTIEDDKLTPPVRAPRLRPR
ncbi:MAG: ABC transporter substrate-binding protein [Solirubrobacteraceae bacterium]